jgi:hypothetical protein
MPINTTIAVPYSVMKDYLRGNPTNRISALAQRHDRVWIISITSPYSPTSINDCPPLVEDGEDRIALQFDDLDLNPDPEFPEFHDPDVVFFDHRTDPTLSNEMRLYKKGGKVVFTKEDKL